MNKGPIYFDEFFASGKEETISPFLIPESRKWGKNTSLKSSILSLVFLSLSFACSFFYPPISSLFLLVVYFLAGTPALIHALHDIGKLEINIDVLMTLAALLSVLIGSGMEGGLLLVLFEISGAMEETVSKKTKNALSSLHELAPKTAFIIESSGEIYEKAIREIEVGTHLLVKAGEIIPLDGQVVEGSSFLNLVHLTGESQPIAKKVGDSVPAGGRNLDGTLTIVVERASSDSTLNKIIELITQAQEAKPKVQQFLDRFGKWYATSIICLSTFFALFLPHLFPISYLGIEGSIYRALTFLIAASPCALIIATPTAYLSAISSCTKKGILLKGGIVLDALTHCHTVAFDKTGTLTSGSLTCEKVEQMGGSFLSIEEAISIAASLEKHAVHPIAQALLDYAEKKKISLQKVEAFLSLPGFGLQGMVGGKEAFIGHLDFIQEKSGSSLPLPTTDKPTTYLWVDKALFLFSFSDTIRPQAKSVISDLKKKKLDIVMLTGDLPGNAKTVAQELGIAHFFAELRPEDKLQKVSDLSREKGLLMIGDGVNDAPALARATVGISMGKIGSATAIDSSDIVFLQDDLSLLGWLYDKAHLTVKIVKQNLSLALGVICFVTTPALLGFVPLWLAVVLHEGGTVLVGLNSLRLLKK